MKLKPIEAQKETVQDVKEYGKKEKKETKARGKKPRTFGDFWLRIGILAAIVLVGFIIVNEKYNKKQDAPGILGSENEIHEAPSTQELVSDITSEVTDTSTYLAGDILGAATDFIDDTKKDMTESATKIIVDVAVNNVITQIEKLPGVDREQVKKYICE